MTENGAGEPTEAARDQVRVGRFDKVAGMNEGMRVLSYLISGVALYGFLGWVADHFLGTHALLPIGIIVGAALGCYVIIRRFGRVEETAAAEAAPVVSRRPQGATASARRIEDGREGAR